MTKLLLGGVDRARLGQIQYLASDEYGNLNYKQFFDQNTGLIGLQNAQYDCRGVKEFGNFKGSLGFCCGLSF